MQKTISRGLKSTALGLAALTIAAGATFAADPLVSTEWLESRLNSDEIVVLDLRTAIAKSGKDDYLKGHIPGAVWSNYPGAWRTERDRVTGVIPSVVKLEAYLSELGVSEDKTVVLVPAGKGSTDFGVAARIYWTLKYLGHDEVSILDGGWKAWTEAGLSTEPGNVVPEGDLFIAEPREDLLISTADVGGLVGGETLLVDGRPESQFLGKEKHSDAVRYGRIPGAINLDQNNFYDAKTERLLPTDRIKAAIPASFSKEADIVSYCNTGHWAATNWFVLHELLDYENVRLYDESMVGWTIDSSREVASDRTRLDDLKAWWSGGS
ncbi:MAG TPA: sulfurtransferase [Afifellaceae bacterium]|nr:sulfurtransferase [Afifellaceae bacterium]